jgi:hypothetical protein
MGVPRNKVKRKSKVASWCYGMRLGQAGKKPGRPERARVQSDITAVHELNMPPEGPGLHNVIWGHARPVSRVHSYKISRKREGMKGGP